MLTLGTFEHVEPAWTPSPEMKNPQNVNEVLAAPNRNDWVRAIEKEFNNMNCPSVYDDVDHTDDMHVIDSGWVFARKFKDGKFELSHFSGARPSQLFITPRSDGTSGWIARRLAMGARSTVSREVSAFARALPEQPRIKKLYDEITQQH